jgi:DNA-binding NarL/FixJ family response regulator
MRASDRDPIRPRIALTFNPTVRRLSDREREIAVLVADGLKDAVIARRRGLALGTVRTYIGHIRQRLGLASRAEIAAWVQARRDPDDPAGRLRRTHAP